MERWNNIANEAFFEEAMRSDGEKQIDILSEVFCRPDWVRWTNWRFIVADQDK